MRKSKKQSEDFGEKSRAVYRSRRLFIVISLCFLIEILALIWRSGVVVTINPEVKTYKEQAEASCDVDYVVWGDIFDRNQKTLIEFNEPITKDKGTYIDDYIYSNLLGYYANNSWGFIDKYKKVLRSIPSVNSEKGNSIQLTLDHELQVEVAKVLSERIGKEGRGSMVVLDAETGEILSMVSLPSFQVSNLKEEMKWMNESTEIWYPMAVSRVVAPGSIFKVLSSVILLENVGEDHTEIDSEFQAGNNVIHNYYPSTGKSIDYVKALEKSSNVFFAKSILGMGTQEEVSKILTQKAKCLSIGDDLELDFGKVTSSWTFDESTLKALEKVGNEKVDLDYNIAATAFGQSEVRFSGLQGAMLAAAIRNKGKVVTPYMVERIINCKGISIDLDEEALDKQIKGLTNEHGKVLSQLTDENIANKVLKAMQNAATVSYKFDPTWGVAAKSGTSETGVDGNSGNNAWMISSAEIKSHKYAIAINWAKADKNIHGSDMAEPIKKIYQYLMNRK